jgi:hypothetical protein
MEYGRPYPRGGLYENMAEAALAERDPSAYARLQRMKLGAGIAAISMFFILFASAIVVSVIQNKKQQKAARLAAAQRLIGDRKERERLLQQQKQQMFSAAPASPKPKSRYEAKFNQDHRPL